MFRSSLIRLRQTHVFSNEIALLRAGRIMSTKNKLENFNALVDTNSEILCIEGSLSGSKLPLDR
jgi:hypothetical protein